jgi:hyperosmotically inducible periplasmic protein
MKKNVIVLASTLLLLTISAVSQQADRNQPSAKSQDRISREVRHELLMLPYFGVFDNIGYRVDGSTVTLIGQVVRPTLKSDAENSVKRIEGVEKIDNQIEVLPPSSMDDGLRLRLFRAIYQFPSLQKYELGVQKPIRIIVKNGRATLEGVVDTQADKDTAGVRANTVPGLFSVTNNLQVAEPK